MSTVTLDAVARVVGDVFGVPAGAITRDTGPNEVPNWDSMQHLNLMSALEHEFGVEIDPEEALQMTSIGAVVDVLTRLKRE